MKIALLTANIGDFDNVLEIPKQSVPYDYFLYTENNLPVPLSVYKYRQKATYIKHQHHRFLPGYDFYVWIDGRIEVTSGDFISDIISQTETISAAKHPLRINVYDEYKFMLKWMSEPGKAGKYLNSRYDIKAIAAERLKIKADLPLYACGVFCWKVSDYMKSFMNDWYRRTMEYSGFDQCWFSQVAFERGVKVNGYGWDKIKLGQHK